MGCGAGRSSTSSLSGTPRGCRPPRARPVAARQALGRSRTHGAALLPRLILSTLPLPQRVPFPLTQPRPLLPCRGMERNDRRAEVHAEHAGAAPGVRAGARHLGAPLGRRGLLQGAVREYLKAYRRQPTDPLIALCCGGPRCPLPELQCHSQGGTTLMSCPLLCLEWSRAGLSVSSCTPVRGRLPRAPALCLGPRVQGPLS